MGQLTYPRGTTFNITHIYQKNGVNSSDGATLLFTVKVPEFDSDSTDAASIIKKNIAMSGATNVIPILPGDVADSVAPGDYNYDIKVIETGGAQYQVDSGTFTLTAGPTNRLS